MQPTRRTMLPHRPLPPLCYFLVIGIVCLNQAVALSTTVAQRLLDRVRSNNRAGDAKALPFFVGDQPMGKVLPPAVQVLSQYPSVFSITNEGLSLVDRDEWLTDDLVEQRSQAVQEVLLDLRSQDVVPALQGWRDEPFAVRESFHATPALIMERAAAVLFGVPAYGVFLNGYTCEDSVEKHPTHVWVGRRSTTKATWPGRLDSLAAGGLAAGMLPLEAMCKECSEEAGIDNETPRAVSAVSYTGFNEDGWGLKRDVLFCFDLELPIDFEPVPVDGEMDGFEKISVDKVLDMLAMPVLLDDSDNAWKPNVGVVLIDLLVRHGAVDVDDPAFLELIDALRSARCA